MSRPDSVLGDRAVKSLSAQSTVGSKQRRSDRRSYAFIAAAVAMMFAYIGVQHAPLRSELTIARGVVTSAGWKGLIRLQRFEFRIDTSSLLFRVRARLMPKSSPDLAALLKPGTQIVVGHNDNTSFFLDSTDVLLLVVDGKEYYGPEPIHDQIVSDRPMSAALAIALFLLAGYLFRSGGARPRGSERVT